MPIFTQTLTFIDMINPFLNIDEEDHLENDAKEFDKLIQELKKVYQVKEGKTHSLINYALVNSEHKMKIVRRFGIYKSKVENCTLLEAQYSYRYDTNSPYDGKATIEVFRAYPFCIFEHETNLGHLLIRPETAADKISELFNPVEIDFKNHKKFSFKYYVLAEDEALVRKAMPKELLEYLKHKKGVSLEIQGKYCLIRALKVIKIQPGLELIQTALEIQKILSVENNS